MKPANIAIDARIALQQMRGWGCYAVRLLYNMAQQYPQIRFHVLLPDSNAARAAELALNDFPNIKLYATSFKEDNPDHFWQVGDERCYPEYWIDAQVDLLHSLTRFVPPTDIRPVIATVHDIVPLSSTPFKLKYKRSTLACLETLKDPGFHIIAVSEFTKNELRSQKTMQKKHIRVIHEGFSEFPERFLPDRDTEKFENYILYAGGAGENKNLKVLFEAVSLARQTNKSLNLVLAGDLSWDYERTLGIQKKIDWIHQVGFVTEEELGNLYRNALMFIFPSLHEGFGLPLVEAMYCGTPIVAAEIPVFREIAGDAALFFNPHSVDDLVEKIHLLADNSVLRQNLIAHGKTRAKSFRWDDCAKATVGVYADVLRHCKFSADRFNSKELNDWMLETN